MGEFTGVLLCDAVATAFFIVLVSATTAVGLVRLRLAIVLVATLPAEPATSCCMRSVLGGVVVPTGPKFGTNVESTVTCAALLLEAERSFLAC